MKVKKMAFGGVVLAGIAAPALIGAQPAGASSAAWYDGDVPFSSCTAHINMNGGARTASIQLTSTCASSAIQVKAAWKDAPGHIAVDTRGGYAVPGQTPYTAWAQSPGDFAGACWGVYIGGTWYQYQNNGDTGIVYGCRWGNAW